MKDKTITPNIDDIINKIAIEIASDFTDLLIEKEQLYLFFKESEEKMEKRVVSFMLHNGYINFGTYQDLEHYISLKVLEACKLFFDFLAE